MKTKNIFLFVAIFFLSTNIIAGNCEKYNFAFKPGEKCQYDLYFNWGFIWIKAASSELSVKEKIYKGIPVYELKMASSTIKTFKRFDLQDTMLSYVDKETLFPYYVKQSSKEPDYFAKNRLIFFNTDTTFGIYLEEERKKGTKRDTIIYNKCFFDLVSTLYRFRNIDSKKLKPNEKIPMPMVFTDEIYELSLRYAGKEKVELHNGKSYNCLIVKSTLAEGKFFEKGEGMTIWISDDENHIPLMIEAKMKLGSLKAVLSKVQNNRHPISSEIKE